MNVIAMAPREALRQAFQTRVREVGASWVDAMAFVPGINPASPADAQLVRRTVENMARAGELVALPTDQPTGGRGRPRRVYVSATAVAANDGAGDANPFAAANDASAELASLLNAWGA